MGKGLFSKGSLMRDTTHDDNFEEILKRAIAAHRRRLNVFAPDEHPIEHYAEQEREAMLAAMISIIEDYELLAEGV
jgi:hypothetical protein